MADVRVRFSPAPSGSLHVGSAHTALFNWLFARHHGGTFILRVEDTDVTRSRAEWVEGIQTTMAWLGLDWDEGPVLQSTRFSRYLAAADQLIASGHAYECYCTEEELKARNEAAMAAGRPPGYDAHCRDLSPDERAALAAEGRTASIRFRTPDDGVSTFDDLIRGEVSVEWTHIADFVIVRSGGTPLFFLANALDDLEMAITHVIRGEDLLDSTHRVLALRAALGAPDRPVYAHLPLLVGADRGKLSKRHGAVALEDFRDRGYLPEALFNYLALLGWSPDDDREIMSRDELVAAFDLSGVTHSAAFFDYQKLDWFNGQYFRKLPTKEYEALVKPLLPSVDDPGLVSMIATTTQSRVVTLDQVVEMSDFLFSDPEMTPETQELLAETPRVAEVLDAVITHIEQCDWTVDGIAFQPVIKELGLKAKQVMPALYAAVEGRPAGLPLFDSMHALGRERTLDLLRKARAAVPGDG